MFVEPEETSEISAGEQWDLVTVESEQLLNVFDWVAFESEKCCCLSNRWGWTECNWVDPWGWKVVNE